MKLVTEDILKSYEERQTVLLRRRLCQSYNLRYFPLLENVPAVQKRCETGITAYLAITALDAVLRELF